MDGWGRDCYYGAQNLNHYHVWLARCEIVESLPACLRLLLLVGRSSHLVGLAFRRPPLLRRWLSVDL